MKRTLALEDFASAEAPPLEQPAASVLDERISLDAYEEGYKSGWADCAKAEADVRKSVGTELAQRLREAELTHAAAHKDVLASLKPFFEDFVATLLPRMAAEAVTPLAIHELQHLLQQDPSAKIEIAAAPRSIETIQRLLEAEGVERAVVREESAFSESQVSLRAGSERRDIDLSEVARKITDAIRAFHSKVEDQSIIREPLEKGAK